VSEPHRVLVQWVKHRYREISQLGGSNNVFRDACLLAFQIHFYLDFLPGANGRLSSANATSTPSGASDIHAYRTQSNIVAWRIPRHPTSSHTPTAN
jgi:hypothetical protein